MRDLPSIATQLSPARIPARRWAAQEDELILECVRHLGCKWRQIASLLVLQVEGSGTRGKEGEVGGNLGGNS